MQANLVACVEQEKRNDNGSQHIHERRCNDSGANPAHILAQQSARGFLEFADLEVFHAEGFDDAVASGRFLQNLAKIAKPQLAVFCRATNPSRKFANGENNERQQDSRCQGHFPVDDQKDGDENEKREAFLEEIDKEFAEGGPEAIYIVDRNGHDASGGVIAKEADGLPKNFREDGIAQIGDGSVAHAVDFGGSQVLGDSLCKEDGQKSKSENRPDVVDARRKEIVQIDGVAAPGKGHKFDGADGHGRVKNLIDGRGYEECDDAFRKRYEGQQKHTRDKPKGVGPNVT